MPTTVNKGRPTVAMIAKAAGVSRAAVYAALNHHNTTNIRLSRETRSKIEAAIQQLGYIPNNNARSLVSGRSCNIGLLLINLSAHFDNKLAGAFKQVFGRRHYHIMVDYHGNSPEAECEKLRNFYAQGVDALILSQTYPETGRDILSRFVAGGARVIVMGGVARFSDYSYISFDEPEIMRLVAAHLKQAGVRQVAYLAGQSPGTGERDRCEFLKQALRQHGLPELSSAAYLVGYDSICRQVAAWFAPGSAVPEAIVCFNDRLARVLIHVLREAGIKVPEEVRVIGVDDDNDPYEPMPLTTVRLPMEPLAEIAWNCFSGRHAVSPGPESWVRPELIIRQSSPANPVHRKESR